MCVRLRQGNNRGIRYLSHRGTLVERGRGMTLRHRLYCALFSHAWMDGCIGDGWSAPGSRHSGTCGGSFHTELVRRA